MRTILIALVASAASSAVCIAQDTPSRLTAVERRIVAQVEHDTAAALALLERTVNINSGSLKRAGVRSVADVLRPEFEALGFTVRYDELPDSVQRGPHLIAERKGARGKRILLIGHLDTVFEESSPFQRFQRIDRNTAGGPGVQDMKGGNVVILYALRALHAAGALENTTITVVLTGDEESVGQPIAVARKSLIEAGRNSDIALGFEGGSRDDEGDLFVIARRGSSSWTLRVSGRPAHSSGIFSSGTGAGAIFEVARILDRFYAEVRFNPNVTFSPALIAGGGEAMLDEAEVRASGKTNIVAAQAIVKGDLRTLTDEELEQTRTRMRALVAQNLPGTAAQISFEDRYPNMAPTEGNRALLRRVDEVNRALGLGPVRAFEPSRRGAADVSFVAPYLDAMDGLGPLGSGSHTDRERMDVESLHTATKRAAVLIYRLTR
ncbi:MAG: M20/M25/M40 family metallo-hydrolase [Gemmatimonadota bacterium]